MPPTQFGVFQDVLTQFQSVTGTWLGGLYQIGTNLFYMLAAIELILVGVTGTLRRDLEQLAIDWCAPSPASWRCSRSSSTGRTGYRTA